MPPRVMENGGRGDSTRYYSPKARGSKRQHALSLEVLLVEVVDERRVSTPQAPRLYQLLHQLSLHGIAARGWRRRRQGGGGQSGGAGQDIPKALFRPERCGHANQASRLQTPSDNLARTKRRERSLTLPTPPPPLPHRRCC